MGRIIEYEHHGVMVKVDEDLKGTHRSHCLCFRCKFFEPGQITNCPKASRLYHLCCEEGMTTPVFECPNFEEK